MSIIIGNSSAALYDQASEAAKRAAHCRDVAQRLDVRRGALVDRHREAAALHTDAVWRGRAAEVSRTRLHNVIGRGLHSVGADLVSTIAALYNASTGLDNRAASLWAQAEVAARREAEALADRERKAAEARATQQQARVEQEQQARALRAASQSARSRAVPR